MKTAANIIEALGGSGPVMRRLGFQYQSRVSNWPHIGIPRQHWPDLLEFAAEIGVELTMDDLKAQEAAVVQPSTASSSQAA